MFTKNFEEQLLAWKVFRDSLEESDSPFEDLIDFYRRAPRTRISCDPWDKSTWATPWELLSENNYCEFSIVLGMCYSLQLTNRFKDSNFEIHIYTDRENSETHYLLLVDDVIIGYNSKVVLKGELPDALQPQRIYSMPELQ